MSNALPTNPMKGLLPFEASDAFAYYVDARQVESFFRQLEQTHFVALLGRTGSGKTSFVNCIFDEAFKKIRNVNDTWVTIRIRPGLDPLKSLAYQLSTFPEKYLATKLETSFAEDVEQLMLNNSNGLVEFFEKYQLLPDLKLLLVIDPLDDLFLLSELSEDGHKNETASADAFIGLVNIFEQQCTNFPVYTILSFSNSFPEKIGKYPKFLDLIGKHKFSFEPVGMIALDEIMDKIIPKQIKDSEDYILLKQTVKDDLKEAYEDSGEWLFFLQHALKRAIDEWNNGDKAILQCYIKVGGVKNSFTNQANEIYEYHLKKAGPGHQRLFELILRAFMDGKGTFKPMKYIGVINRFSAYYNEDGQSTSKNLVMPFINALAERGLGFLEIIRSVQEHDRTQLLNDKNYISNDDVIVLRNQSLVVKWPLLGTFKNAKTKLVSEYEWYSKIAFERATSKDKHYPTTLQPYALIGETRDKNNDPEEFKVIDELLLLNETWEKANVGIKREGYADVIATQTYIKEAINYWKAKAAETASAQRSKESRRKKIAILSWCTIAAFIIIVPLYRGVLKARSRMTSQLDCLYADNQRLRFSIDSIHLVRVDSLYAASNDRSLASKNSIEDSLDYKTKIWQESLRKAHKLMYQPYDDLYAESELRFAFRYRHWRQKCDSLLHTCTNIHKKVLEGFVSDPLFNGNMKGMQKVNSPWVCDGVVLPTDRFYYINCKECEKCTECE